jgi:3-oxoadipate enol-lactonase
VKIPVLAMWGTLDETSVAECGELLVKALPQAQKHVFEGVAHMVNLERPDEFNRLVSDFVAQAEAAGV